MLGSLQRHLSDLLQRLPEVASAIQSTRRAIVDELSGGDPTIERIAARLHASPRSLQRRLQGEGTSFQTQLDEIRRELAVRYLEELRAPITEVAYLLGFSEPSAFHRAFKRWTGMTPAAYRAANTVADAPAAMKSG